MSGPKILVAVDFSEASLRALREAHRLADALGASLRVLHVHDPPPDLRAALLTHLGPAPEEAAPYRPATVESLHERLCEACQRALGDASAGRPEVHVGHAREGILAAARAEGATLLVVGASGHGTAGRLILGSVSEFLVRRSPIPVMVTP